MIIGLTGKNAAGKGEIVNYLKSKGFIYHSLSDALREEATKRGIEHTRDNLISLGNDLRKKHGATYLAEKISEKIQNTKKLHSKCNFFVVDSIRSPYEIEELRKNKDFVLLGINAPIELRFGRMKKRGRLGDANTIEKLKEQEEKENSNDSTGQQLDKCFKMADFVVMNEGTLEELQKIIDDFLDLIKEKTLNF